MVLLSHAMLPVPYLLVICALWSAADAYSDQFYTAAVFEHAVVFNYSTEENLRINLAYYRNAARVAKDQGADIITFPEYGILAAIQDRQKLRKFAEFVPDPKRIRTKPCSEPEQYSSRPILRALSCMAKDYSLVVVANTAHVEPCQGETGCRDDGDLIHNTNVAFDSDGILIGRYHKERLFFEPPMDLPKKEQDPTFVTGFGRFGMFTSFDIVFEKITEVAREKVEAILMPAVWIDTAPFMTSVQLWQWWAIGNNVTFMAANVHHPGYTVVGSGIFTARGEPLGYTHSPDAKSKLITARVPRSKSATLPQVPKTSVQVITQHGARDHKTDRRVPEVCSHKILGEATNFFEDYRCFQEDTVNYTFVKLRKSRGQAQACHNGLCCSVRYTADSMTENYYLGVYNGTYDMHGGFFWCQQNCLLVRCDAADASSSCETFPTRSKTNFYRVYLTANTTAEYIYPTVLASGIRLVSFSHWQHGSRPDKAYVNFEDASGKSLLVVGLHGRCYSNDPPYIR